MTDDEIAEMERDPVAYLGKMLAEVGARVTIDARRCTTDPCWMCGTSKAPRDLVTIGTYTRPMGGNLRPGDRIDRPLCASCEKLTQPPPAPAEAPAMPDTSIPVRMVLDLEPDEHAEWLALAKAAGLTIEEWLVATVRAVRAVER